MKKKRILALLAAFMLAVPLFAVLGEKNLAQTLHALRCELEMDYEKIFASQGRLAQRHGQQHDRMISIMKKCNELALMLYSQKQEYTFDLTYALESVSEEYNDFNRSRMPYDRIVGFQSAVHTYGRYARIYSRDRTEGEKSGDRLRNLSGRGKTR